MRPPIPPLHLSRRVKITLWVIAALIALLIIASSLVGVYVDWLWFGSVGFRGVYKSIITTRLLLFVIFGVVMALIVGGNMVIAYALRPPFRPASTEQQNLERYRTVLEPRKRLILAGVMLICFIGAGLSAQSAWRTWLLWRYGGSFGVKDPQFHMDISFFAWDYPVYRLLLGFFFTAVLFSLLVSLAMHYLFGAIRLQTPGPKFTLTARRHITILIFAFILLKALAYWLDRYGLVFSTRGKVTGASYTDVHASLPAKTILFWIAVIIAIGVLATLWLRSALLPAIGFVVLLVLSIVINGIYPAIVQQFSVKPNASDKESLYIKRNITATRQAYGIVSQPDGGLVDYINVDATSSGDAATLKADAATVTNIRLLDPNIIAPTFLQQQQLKNVYGFADKLDIDRYVVRDVEKNGTTVTEECPLTNRPAGCVTRDYVVGVRELKAANLTGNQRNWINSHTVYTHGYGFVAAQANQPVNLKEDFAEGNIPPTGFLDVKQPQAYYGELMPEYSIVGSEGTREYDGSDQKTSYKGTGGVSLGSFFTRLALAVKYKETNFLLNNAASAKGARIIFDRNPRDMVLKAAPFLKVDADPYPAVIDGRIVWMVDGYTTMANYPYSERQSLSSLTANSLSETNRTASQPNSQINYIRNSVKATVDAYDGTIHLYAWDATDPVLKAWMRAFPGLVQPRSDIPPEVLAHMRYPEDLFQVQRALLASYHVDNPVAFYNVTNQWTVPNDPTNGTGADQPPYYLLAGQPGASTPNAQFQLTTPMRVNSRQNLAAYISVDSEPGSSYGKLTVLQLPTGSSVQGPEQVFNRFSSEPAISKDISLLSSGGSSVLHGNLLTLPVGQTFLYVEPLYVQRAGTDSFPLLQAILLYYGDKIGYGSTVLDAITHLSVPGQVPPLSTTAGQVTTPPPTTSAPPPTTSAPPPTTSAPPTTSPPTNLGLIITQLDAAMQRLESAYKSGDPAAIGQAQADVYRLTQEYLRARGPDSNGSATPKPSGTPSPSRR